MTAAVRNTGAAASRRQFRDLVLCYRWRAVWINALFGFVLAAAMGSKPPSVHDEFSYRLSGDTFARGRLTNPTHPMWRHFETFHVLHRPTYTSKYPPGQGLMLATGIRLAGSPALAVWVSCGLMVAALTWMLQAWVTPRWAFWGGVAGALWIVGRHAFGGYWATSLWGGTVAASGGMLVLGAMRRLARAPTIGGSIALGSGAAILANSRPFEGLFFSVVPGVVVATIVIRHLRGRQWRTAFVTAAPALAVLVLAAVFMAAHNRATTNSATELPYMRHYKTYDSSPIIAWQRVPPTPVYPVRELENFYLRGNGFTRVPALGDIPGHLSRNSLGLNFYLPLMALPLFLALPWIIRGRWRSLAAWSLGTTLLACMLTLCFWQPHYAAPAAGAIAILYVNAARFYSRLHRTGIKGGRVLTRLILVSLMVSATVQFAANRLYPDRNSWAWNREIIQQRLAAEGRHFVLVAYGKEHSPNAEWVYNDADIDASPVVWARSLGEAEDAAFMGYFADRQGWRLQIDDDLGPFTLMPIPR